MTANPVKIGIVGLGRWAKVLTRAAARSEKIKIVTAFSRSEEKRTAFEQDTGVPTVPDLKAMLSNCEVEGAILTVPNEQHLAVAAEVAKARKHVYTDQDLALVQTPCSRRAAFAARHSSVRRAALSRWRNRRS